MFRNCSNLETIDLPNAIRGIGNHTFDGCTNLRRIILPSGMRRIGAAAFERCSSLMEVHVMGAAPAKISSSTFAKSTQKEGTLFVRYGTITNYQLDKNWNRFLDMIEVTDQGQIVVNQ